MKIDWKQIIGVVVGLLLGVLGAHFGIDFKASIPSMPTPAASVTVEK